MKDPCIGTQAHPILAKAATLREGFACLGRRISEASRAEEAAKSQQPIVKSEARGTQHSLSAMLHWPARWCE